MAMRSLNKVQLIGNLTRDPELRYTPQGTAVCTFGLATNRSWVTDSGEKKEEVEFSRVVAWNKLAEICSQLLSKGRRIYVEGRLSTRSWSAQDGTQRQTTEVVAQDMIILDSRGFPGGETSGDITGSSDTAGPGEVEVTADVGEEAHEEARPAKTESEEEEKPKKGKGKKIEEKGSEDDEEGMPF